MPRTRHTVSTCFTLIIIIKKETKLLSPLLNTDDVSRLGFPHPASTHSQLRTLTCPSYPHLSSPQAWISPKNLEGRPKAPPPSPRISPRAKAHGVDHVYLQLDDRQELHWLQRPQQPVSSLLIQDLSVSSLSQSALECPRQVIHTSGYSRGMLTAAFPTFNSTNI